MEVYINRQQPHYFYVKYVLELMQAHMKSPFSFVQEANEEGLIFDSTNSSSKPLAHWFYKQLDQNPALLKHDKVFLDETIIKDKEGMPDYVATIFYMVNCIQEYNPEETDLDGYNRFKYSSSYQSRFDCIESNLVLEYINILIDEWGIERKVIKSNVFISHDIDQMYSSLKQDGGWILKKGKISSLLQFTKEFISGKKSWRNINHLLSINKKYKFSSTFFWLPEYGKSTNGIINADYQIEKEQDLINRVEAAGAYNGLHKSSFDNSIDKEIKTIGLNVRSNRFHFLKFLPHLQWPELEASQIQLDCSLGFAEKPGFRNSYGAVFSPFNFETKEAYSLKIAPLNIMDASFRSYLGTPVKEIGDYIINFISENPNNCNLSILWHNNYFTDYKFSGYQQEFIKVLDWLKLNKVSIVSEGDFIT